MSKYPGGIYEIPCTRPGCNCPSARGEAADVGSSGTVRQFDTGATRDTDEGKFDFEGFLSPAVLYRFAEYMHKNRIQSDGTMRASDNWQRGIPRDQYMKSMFRHFMEVWTRHRAEPIVLLEDEMEDALCALLFNVMGYLFEMKDGR